MNGNAKIVYLCWKRLDLTGAFIHKALNYNTYVTHRIFSRGRHTHLEECTGNPQHKHQSGGFVTVISFLTHFVQADIKRISVHLIERKPTSLKVCVSISFTLKWKQRFYRVGKSSVHMWMQKSPFFCVGLICCLPFKAGGFFPHCSSCFQLTSCFFSGRRIRREAKWQDCTNRLDFCFVSPFRSL